ncbi:MAG: GNAT family N-acetyltransferase [Alphaproteobacteria bacterium]|nr:GNAT family N-acetyltransferase [Alphaproteobacteria bacterium]
MTEVWERTREDGFVISTDTSRLDMSWIVDFLKNESYWANHISGAVIEKSIRNSIPFGLYNPAGKQSGFSLVVSDRARYAWLGDVCIDKACRGRGLGVWLVQNVLAYPEFETVNRWALRTKDAHTLYEKFGFRRTGDSEGRAMELTWP